MKTYIVTTDASWFLNGNVCGWAAVVEHDNGIYSKSGVAGRIESSSAAELVAVVAALKLFNEPSRILIRTDSQYVLGICGNLNAWRLKGWKRTKKHMMENSEALNCLWTLCKKHQVSFQHVKGHAGDLANMRADKLAFSALSKNCGAK